MIISLVNLNKFLGCLSLCVLCVCFFLFFIFFGKNLLANIFFLFFHYQNWKSRELWASSIRGVVYILRLNANQLHDEELKTTSNQIELAQWNIKAKWKSIETFQWTAYMHWKIIFFFFIINLTLMFSFHVIYVINLLMVNSMCCVIFFFFDVSSYKLLLISTADGRNWLKVSSPGFRNWRSKQRFHRLYQLQNTFIWW